MMRPFVPTIPVVMLAVTILLACGSKGGGATGGGSGMHTASSGGEGAGGSATKPGCVDDGVCDLRVGAENCTCADCKGGPACGACVVDQKCTADDACTCADCWSDGFCGDPMRCTDDGLCDQFIEGCQCADCSSEPNCAGWTPPRDAGTD